MFDSRPGQIGHGVATTATFLVSCAGAAKYSEVKKLFVSDQFPGVRKVGIWSENMLKSGSAWLQAKIAELPPPLVVCQAQILQNLS